jgi:OOP family OmpA-OmpF porin
MKHYSPLLLSAVLAATLLPLAAFAQSYNNQGYLVDGAGRIVTSSTSGLCWRTNEWTPARAVAPCDPVIARAAVMPPIQDTVPTPMAVAPAVVPPMRVLPQKLSFSADALFAFDKADLKPEGKTMLDDLARQLNGAQYDVVVVTGHADRLGSAAYNQRLSEQRANAVKAYLVGQSIPATRITASGQGETQPTTQAGDCVGSKKTAKLVACLQPDRRVDVEMQGTKPQ